MIALQVLLSTACFPCPFTHGSPSSVVQVTRAAVLVACADWKTQQDAESEASTRSRADEAQLAAAREALAIAADAREAGDLGPAREFLDQALDALSGMTSPLGMEAGGVLELRLAAEREFRFFATDAMRSGDIDGARGFVRKIVEAVRGLESVDSVEVRGAWDALDVMTESLGMLETQLTVREWIVQASERALPADHGDTLEAQHNLAVTRERLGHYEEALELFEVVHEARKRLLHPDHLLLLRTKLSLAITLQGVGQLERALEFFEHVYAARKRLLPPDSRELLTAELNLAATLRQVGRAEEALPHSQHLHAVCERILDPDDGLLLSAKQGLALTLKGLRDFEGALEFERHVHAIREQLLPAEHPALLDAKANLALTLFELGDLENALPLLEHVLTVRQRLHPPDHTDVLTAQLNLIDIRATLGDLEGARIMAERVHAGFEKKLPRGHPTLLIAKSSLARRRFLLGDFEGALVLQEYVHAAWGLRVSASHSSMLTAKMELAATLEGLSEHETALPLVEHVHEVRAQLLSPHDPSLLHTKNALAHLRRAVGNYQGAIELAEQVYASREARFHADHPSLLRAKYHLGRMRWAAGDLGGALLLFEEIHAASERSPSQDLAVPDGARMNLALLRRLTGDAEGARALSVTFIPSTLARLDTLRATSPRAARSAAFHELRELSVTFTAVTWIGGSEAETKAIVVPQFFSAVEDLRLISTSSSAVALAVAHHPELKDVSARLADARSKLNDLSLSAPEQAADVEAREEELLRSVSVRDRLERELRSQLGMRGVFSEPITPELVAKGLARGSALVSFWQYTRHRHFEVDPATGAVQPCVDSVLAFVVTPDASVHMVELGPSHELEELVRDWRASLGKPVRGVGIGESGIDEGEAGRLLRERILDPCLAVLGDQRPEKLHIVLDDFLHLVPVDALPWKDGRRVGEVLPIQLEVSLERLVSAREPTSAEGTLVALGWADFEAEGIEAPRFRTTTSAPPTQARGSRSVVMGIFEPLLQSRYEVETLGGQYRELVGGEPVVLLEGQASKKALAEFAPRARYLHIATHGWFAPEVFQSMRDSLEEESQELHASLSHAEDAVRGFAPETLCGLALAGANHGANLLGRVPGILTAEELATLDLSNCELAVLSACETNVGIRRAGQGIQSLQSALHAAGARTAITSLWKVDDAATRRLMEVFYTKLWREGSGKADALWQAKMALKQEGHSVRDWAGWVLTGSPD